MAAFCWGIAGIFTKSITPHGFTALEMVFLKNFIGLIILFFISLPKGKELFKIKNMSDLLNLIFAGVFGYALYSFAFIETLNEMGVGIAGVMLYSKCAFVMIIMRILYREPITAKKLVAMIMTIAGCISISGMISSGNTTFTAKGMAWGIVSGIGFAIYDVFSKKSLDKYSSETVTFYIFLISTVFTAFIANPLTSFNKVLTTNTTILILSYGIVVSALPYFLYANGLSKMDVSLASVLSTFELLTAAVAGIILYNEPLTISKVAGIVLIIGAVCVLNISVKKKYF